VAVGVVSHFLVDELYVEPVGQVIVQEVLLIIGLSFIELGVDTGLIEFLLLPLVTGASFAVFTVDTGSANTDTDNKVNINNDFFILASFVLNVK
jgi:hypothetical protein